MTGLQSGILIGTMVAACLYPLAIRSQTFTQVYPDHVVHDYHALVRWNGDTLFVAGDNSGFMRSTDAGLTWTDVFHSNTGYDFVQMEKNSTGIYLLPAPSPATQPQFADTTSMFILRYDPWTDDTTRITVPCPIHDISLNRSLFCDLSVTAEGVHILQVVRPDTVNRWSSLRSMTLLSRSNDEATWRQVAMPDSTSSMIPSIFFRDHIRGILISGHRQDPYCLFTTTDGGANWRRVPNVHGAMRGPNGTTVRASAQWVDDSTFILATDKYTLKKTTDMGLTWDSIQVMTPKISTFAFLPNGTGIVSGEGQDIIRTTDYGANWQIIHPGWGAPGGGPVMQTLMIDSNTSITAGYNGRMYRTSDAGVTWDAPFFTSRGYSPLHFSTDDRGLGYCSSYFETIENQYCTTSDGGATWNEAFSRYAVPGCISVEPVDDQQLWAIQDYPNKYDTLIYLTKNGGTSWEGVCLRSVLGDTLNFATRRKSILNCGRDSFMVFSDHGILRTVNRGVTWEVMPQILTLLPDSISMLGSLIEIFCQNARYQWFVFNDRILRSSNFGATWETMREIPLPPGIMGPIFASRAVDGMTLCAFIENPDHTGSFHLTTDAGVTWQQYDNNQLWPGHSYGPSMQAMFPGGIGYSIITTSLIYENESVVYKTEDYWRTAKPVFVTHSAAGRASFYFRNASTGWVSNSYMIYRTTNGGIDWVQSEAPVPSGVRLEAPFPNPIARGSDALIPFTVTGDRPTPVSIDVFDCLGRRMHGRYASSALPGRHTIRWDARGAAPGVYLVRLTSAKGVECVKIVLR